MDLATLRAELYADRLAAYRRLRGGFPIPLAGALYWGALGLLGSRLDTGAWLMAAFFGTGLIFPLALLLARAFGNKFMKDRSAAGSVLVPAFVSMLLFWPMVIAAMQSDPQLVPLILAIGLSLHWPVIGWGYGRTALFSAHAIVRAVVVLAIWLAMPQARFTLLPLAVSAIYLATVLVILVDTAWLRRTQERLAV